MSQYCSINRTSMSDDVSQRIIERALLSRLVEERLFQLFADGELFGTIHTCIGQEFSGACIAEHLGPQDTIFSNHRCHGHFLSTRGDVFGLIAEVMGREAGVCGGRGGSQHLYKDGFFSNGIQGGIVPVAAGLAFAHKIQNLRNISVVFIGDGTLGEGVIYETFNIAAKWNLPLLIVLENNECAQSTLQHETLSGSIMDRAKAFGLSVAHADTWNWKNLYSVSGELIERMRSTQQPAFLQIDTFRLKAHSKGDDTRGRDTIIPFEMADPLNQLNAGDVESLISKLNIEIESCVERARKSPWTKSSGPEEGVELLEWSPVPKGSNQRFVKALNSAFHTTMSSNPNTFFIGEDVKSPYGGAFKVSQGLSVEFSDRVHNTPISESAITGIGIGLSLMGFRPFVEIMFGDFCTLAFDQLLNHAAKFQFMYNNQVDVNLVVRTPMGGRRGYGATHSQTLDKHFLGIPGLRVLALNNLIDPSIIVAALVKSRGPTLLIENKVLYTDLMSSAPECFSILSSNEEFPCIWIQPASDHYDVAIISYGGLAADVLTAIDALFEDHDLICTAFFPTQIYPFDVSRILPLLGDTPRLVFIEEGCDFASFSSEVIAQIHERSVGKRPSILRLGPPNTPIPASGVAEASFYIEHQKIVKRIVEFCSED